MTTSFAIHRPSFRPVSPGEADQIRAAAAEGETLASIAGRLGRSTGTVSKILSGKKYHATRGPTRLEAPAEAPATAECRHSKLPHVTAEPFSSAWYVQQNEAFRAAWREAFGGDVAFGHCPETSNGPIVAK